MAAELLDAGCKCGMALRPIKQNVGPYVNKGSEYHVYKQIHIMFTGGLLDITHMCYEYTIPPPSTLANS